MYESSTKETKWVCIQLACSRRPRAFWGSPLLEYTSQVLSLKFPLVYESGKIRDSLSCRSWCYFEALVWKRIVTLSLFYFLFFGSSLFLAFLFFYLAFLFFLAFLFKGQCSNNDDHHTSIYLQLDTRTKYDSIWMPPAVYRDVQWSSIAMTSKNGQAMKTSC